MVKQEVESLVYKTLEDNNGILWLKPAWVARNFLPPGKRLGLKEEEYDMGERGWISERWIASTTTADNGTGPEDEGLSFLKLSNNEKVTLKDAIKNAGRLIIGNNTTSTYEGLGVLAKIFDYADRIPYHIHQMKKDANLVGKNPKDEAYYFPEDVDLGPHPETFFGVHPYIAEQKKYDILLPYLEAWNNDQILKHSRAYLNVQGEGFFLPAGVPHAPGSALTIEIQEQSDVFAMMQALVGGKIISKDLLFKDVTKENRRKYAERIILDQINWEISGDPYFYENYHLEPKLIEKSKQDGAEEYWIFYKTNKFSGKKLVIKPGGSFNSLDSGAYSVLVWRGQGYLDGKYIEGGNFTCDEFVVTHNRATKPLIIKNDGKSDLIIFKFFGPGINFDIPGQ